MQEVLQAGVVQGAGGDALQRETVSGFGFGLGCFHFFVSLVPASFQWLLSIIGFEADRARGLEELRLAEQANGSRCTLASPCSPHTHTSHDT